MRKKPEILPKILKARTIARTRVFHIEELELRFSNGREVTYERARGSAHGSVLIVPVKDQDTLLLVREYCVGPERYELAFPKGLIDAGETALEAGNRELREETGYGARRVTPLMNMSIAPGYHSHVTQAVIAEDLYPSRLEGDEPEPVEVVEWSMNDIHVLLQRDDFSEARSIAALYLTRDYLLGKETSST
ncbi:MAG: ADP compounds hydrolase NudE [Gammaproteobacteria bacterium]|nr:MAG: ADP compounds hydrolase NudE [Gammaproteobacteria bacterium]